MQIADFDYQLPSELIAQQPLPDRAASRLLCLDKTHGVCKHQQFSNLGTFLRQGDLLIFNNTKVIPARLFGQKQTGGQIEILIERIVSTDTAWAHVRASKAPKIGSKLFVADSQLQVIGREEALFKLQITAPLTLMDLLTQQGHMPLPPYIMREDNNQDLKRYQTVYASQEGAVAAPTAGLHFTEQLIADLQRQGVNTAYLTLHVGAGTFQPVRVDNIHEHHMHKEWINVSQNIIDQIKQTKQAGGRVIAVGTTVVRSLETAVRDGELQAYQGDTDIFIYPGFEFKVIDSLITNFHLPKSTLLMLVSALAGMENIKQAYQAAIEERYRFFSYGDAMLIF